MLFYGLFLVLQAILVHSAALRQSSSSSLTTAAREKCQITLQCPPGTLVVSTTEHPLSNFTSLQAAISSLPNDNSSQTILLLSGSYNEQVNITRSGPITLLGQQPDRSALTDAARNTVNLTFAGANQDSSGSLDNVWFSVMIVAPTLDASLTGSGTTGYPVPADTPFGNTNFRVYNIDFRNTFSEYSAGPAHAISFSRSNGGFYYCGFYSYQDTIYIGKLGSAYMYKSILAGQTDFLYGFGTLYVQSSQILLRSCGGGITAWKGTNTTVPNNYGVYIHDSTVRAANISIAPDIKESCALGRPWNALHRSIFANTYEDGSIEPSGYINWEDRWSANETLMAEYKAYGPGFNLTGREDSEVSVLLDSREYARYSDPERVFLFPDGKVGNVGWIDWEVVNS
ncbi:pectin lyase-like protein [Aspergillus sclerotioniger CBS 115572]|uniref:pectinesterase n=1 Tax=Aspergillus sclerotioniger CBS 115572 TaxID=1450535 RepID=A0A317V392_9EURO|nr:pectin lyase-like protein [Aspergillus sclerotioniger CBS 115572]PWY68555.1 pectin lyase-like protein [Aspergillus sclerotioniger CBS 115572]